MNTKEYLRQAKQLETMVYEQQRVIGHIRSTISNLTHFHYESPHSYTSYFSDWDYSILNVLSGFVSFPFGGAIAGFVIVSLFSFFNAIFSFVTISFKTTKKYMLNSILVGAILGLAIYILFIVLDIIKSNKYNKNAKLANQKLEKNNQLLKKVNQTKISYLQKQLLVAQQNLSTTQSILNKLYAQNVLHPKYRNFVAVCSIYEYFDTGRCTVLLGHEGAYNIYENELRLNRIIGQLDTVIEKLDEIINNQYVLYSALINCNNKLNEINRGLNTLSSTANHIAECTEITAYNSRISAQNTQTMNLIMMYDHS